MKIESLINEYRSERDREQNVKDLKIKYFDLFLNKLECYGSTIYLLIGSNYSEPYSQPILLASFDPEELEKAKRGYCDRFTTLIIESCSFV